MATYTPNLNLYKPDASDDFGSFREEFNNNMDKLDNGGGGGSGGHTILDPDGNALPQEDDLQFTGNVSVTDDNVNGKTIVDILGGNVYGAFVDTDRVIQSSTTLTYNNPTTYTATEDCAVIVGYYGTATDGYIKIDGVNASTVYVPSNSPLYLCETVYVRKGQVVTMKSVQNNGAYTVYGLTQGTNGIFAPVIYSDNERVIGVWRDNKPLYQRSFVYTPSATISTTTVITTLSSDIEVKDVKGVAVNTQNNRVLPLCYSGNNFGTNYATSASNDLQIEIYGDTWGTNYTFFATVQYTKTTDVAGSGNWNTDGVPTVHYSTSEQVIGTYLGKPLYEITVEVNSVNHNDWTDVFSLADADIKGYDSRTSYAQLNNGERVQLDWFVTTSIYNRSIITNSGTKFRVETQGNNYSKIVATIQYCKTTD